MHGSGGPPAEEHEEGHPPQGKLDAEIDCAAAREHGGGLNLLACDLVIYRLKEEHDCDCAICGEGDEG